MKFIRVSLFIVIALALTTGGCGKRSSSRTGTGEKSKRTIVFVFKLVGLPYCNLCERGAKQAAKDLGINVEFLGPAKGDDIPGQIRIIESQISRGVDAIVIAPNDPNSVKPVVAKATRRGIPVFTWDTDAPDSERIFYVAAADDVGIGVDLMDRLAKEMGGKGKFAIMSGGQGALNLNLHIEGVLEGLKKYPNITLAKPLLYNNEQQQLAQTCAAGMLERHPDLAGFACINSLAAPGTARALIAAGKAGKVKVWGYSLPSENRQYIKSGVVHGLLLWDPFDLTYLTAKLVNDYLDGKKPVDGMEVVGIGKLKVSEDGIVIMPGVEITKENVDQFDF